MNIQLFNSQLKKIVSTKEDAKPIYKGITYSNGTTFATDGFIYLSGKCVYAPILEGKTCSPIVKTSLLGGRTYIPTTKEDILHIENRIEEYNKNIQAIDVPYDKICESINECNEEQTHIEINGFVYMKERIQQFVDIVNQFIDNDTEKDFSDVVYISTFVMGKGHPDIHPIIMKNDKICLMLANCDDERNTIQAYQIFKIVNS